MNIDSAIIDFDELATEIGIESKDLRLMFTSLKSDTEGIFPLLSKAIQTDDYDAIFRHSDALQGIISVMRLDDLYEVIKSMSLSAQKKDKTFLYAQHFGILKWGIHRILDAYFSLPHE